MEVSVFKDLYKSKDVPFKVPFDKIVQRILVGKSKDLILQIRAEKDKAKRNFLKMQLPSILFAGEFSARNSSSLIKHAGLMVVDFDGYENENIMISHFEKLKQNKHFVCLFVSPSGNGIKGVVKIPPADKRTHPIFFKSFQKKFNFEYFDMLNSNVDRVCFESYDPNIYVNKNAEVFFTDVESHGFRYIEKAPLMPVQEEDEIISKIMKFNFKKSFVKGERNNYIYDVAGLFCEYGVHNDMAIGYLYNNVAAGELSESEVKATINSAYRTRSFNSKFFENYSKLNSVKNNLKMGKDEVKKRFNITDGVYEEIAEDYNKEKFWSITKNKIYISSFDYKNFLEQKGYRKYYAQGTLDYTMVKVLENIVDVVSDLMIKDDVLEHLLEKKEFEVYDYMSKSKNLFSKQYFGLLNTIELVLLKDTANTSFFTFKNGILEVEKNSVKLTEYQDIGRYVWRDNIINHDFLPQENKETDFKKFVYNISNGKPLPLEQTIGYLLSTYKTLSNNKAVILSDDIVSINPEGGTGKGLLMQGIGKLRKVCIIDGKNYKQDDRFAFQNIDFGCDIMLFDDVNKNFSIEGNFSIITEGLVIERKNRDAVRLTVENSPKLVITTNYTIKGDGDSHARRKLEFALHKHYSSKFTPKDDFKKDLFTTWDEKDFNAFFNYMICCLQSYLLADVVEKQETLFFNINQMIAKTSEDFMEFAEDRTMLVLNERFVKTTLYNTFLTEYKDNNVKQYVTAKRFNIWLQKYAGYIDAEFLQGNTQGERWGCIVQKGFEQKQNDFIF